MKKALFLLMTLGLVIGCTSPEKEAQKLITKHLQETLNDWSSYESVSFGDLDSAYTSIYEDSIFQKNAITVQKYLELAKKYNTKADVYSDYPSLMSEALMYLAKAKLYIDSAKSYQDKGNSMIASFCPAFKGYSVTHTYRANNTIGAKVITKEIYTFNPEITEIVNIEQINED